MVRVLHMYSFYNPHRLTILKLSNRTYSLYTIILPHQPRTINLSVWREQRAVIKHAACHRGCCDSAVVHSFPTLRLTNANTLWHCLQAAKPQSMILSLSVTTHNFSQLFDLTMGNRPRARLGYELGYGLFTIGALAGRSPSDPAKRETHTHARRSFWMEKMRDAPEWISCRRLETLPLLFTSQFALAGRDIVIYCFSHIQATSTLIIFDTSLNL